MTLPSFVSVVFILTAAFLYTPLIGHASSDKNVDIERKAQLALFKQYPKLDNQGNNQAVIKTYSTHAKPNRLGLTVVTFQQTYNDITVYQKKASVLVKADGSVASVMGDLAFDVPEQQFPVGDALIELVRDAVALGFSSLGHNVNVAAGSSPLSAVVEIPSAFDTSHTIKLHTNNLDLEQVWYEELGSLIPALRFTIQYEEMATGQRIHHGFIIGINNTDSSLDILETSRQHSHAAHEYTVFGGDTGDLLTANTYGAAPRFYPLIGRPNFRIPAFPFSPQTIHTRSFSTISTADPWLSPARGEAFGTSGNHVNVCIETPVGQLPATEENCGREGWESVPYSNFRAFNWQYDPNNPLSYESRRAAAVNIFYLYNQLHDYFYDIGFDENAGNAQRDNFGRGGEQNDPINVFVMEPSNFNNALTATGPDGLSPEISMHPYLSQSRPFSNQFGITLSATINQGLATEVSLNEELAGVAYSYLGQQVFENVSAKTVALTFDGEDGCSPLNNFDNVKNKIAMYPVETCEVSDTNNIIMDNMIALKEAGAVGIVFGVEQEKIDEYQNSVPFSARIDNPLPHMFLSLDEAFFDIFHAPYLCDDTGDVCDTYTLTLESIDSPIIRDSALGHALSIHEWAHYLAFRLVGTSILTRTQYAALQEGWADFFAIFFMMQQQDQQITGNENWAGIYSFSDWAIDRRFNGSRRVPYTTDFSRNALTLENISNLTEFSAESLGHTIFPSRSPNAEEHNAGEVWATVLLEAYTELLNDTERLSFEQAQLRMMSYIVTSMQMLNPSVTFATAREAFLRTAYAHDPEDYHVLKRAFARRGMGVNFRAPSLFSSSLFGAVNSFDVDFSALINTGNGFNTTVDLAQIIELKEALSDTRDPNLENFNSQVAAALPACATMDDVRYGFFLTGYSSAGDLDINPFEVTITEISSNHVFFDEEGLLKIDGLVYDGSFQRVIPFAYLNTKENIIVDIHATVNADDEVTQPDAIIESLLLNPTDDFDGQNIVTSTVPIDCQFGRDIQGNSATATARVEFNSTVFSLLETEGRQEQSSTITLTNTSNTRLNFVINNRVSDQTSGIEIRHPRALHVPAKATRTFDLRAVNRSEQLPRGRSEMNGALELHDGKETLIIPYSVIAIK